MPDSTSAMRARHRAARGRPSSPPVFRRSRAAGYYWFRTSPKPLRISIRRAPFPRAIAGGAWWICPLRPSGSREGEGRLGSNFPRSPGLSLTHSPFQLDGHRLPRRFCRTAFPACAPSRASRAPRNRARRTRRHRSRRRSRNGCRRPPPRKRPRPRGPQLRRKNMFPRHPRRASAGELSG